MRCARRFALEWKSTPHSCASVAWRLCDTLQRCVFVPLCLRVCTRLSRPLFRPLSTSLSTSLCLRFLFVVVVVVKKKRGCLHPSSTPTLDGRKAPPFTRVLPVSLCRYRLADVHVQPCHRHDADACAVLPHHVWSKLPPRSPKALFSVRCCTTFFDRLASCSRVLFVLG